MDGMSDLERLLAIEDIKLLKARRDRAVDTKDFETYYALHAPDHVSHNDGFDRWNNRDEMIVNVRRLMADNISVHHSHTPDITFDSPSRAVGIWGMEDNIFWRQDGEEHWLQGFGFYHETYEKRDGVWVFTSRQLKRTHVRTSAGAMMGAQRLATNGTKP
ncbi:nuclear transport factor 2 family protein [Phenylobacterium sp. LjRoot219]|uniref:nuclear transport factor 2 family protein n=1 Tax=Phenylobacterium sp. LjRoot219 TaxID=3342283 RepID=UPI003ECD9C9A